MDRRWRRPGALGAALALLLISGVAAARAFPLRAVGWISPQADPVAALSVEPTECLALPADPATRASVEIGRAAFRTPVLLGGQAARAGLSCESCHRVGRTNPVFQFPGVSGPPGTADVTSSIFSSHRGNAKDDPVPIPDLSGDRAQLKVAQDARPAFIRGLIVEEFDGPPPPAAVLAGVVAYVDALSPAACPAASSRPVTLAGLMDDARRALIAAETAPDAATALVMVASARARLGLIDERYAGPALAAERHALRAADARLSVIAKDLREGRPGAAPSLAAWRAESRDLELKLRRRQAQSLFDPKTLHAAT